MSITLTADRIFDTAIQVERNGGAFYRKAATYASKGSLRQTLLELAKVEGAHMQTFAKLKEMLLGPEPYTKWFDPRSHASSYLNMFARNGIFDMTWMRPYP